MRKIDESYSSGITEATRKEFLNFAKWFNTIIGHDPLIVGGWAVYTYVPEGRGSRDVDVIFPDARVKEVAVNQYLAAHGYKEVRKRLFESSFEKEITTKGGERITMEIDAESAGTQVTDENTGIKLIWKLAQQHSRHVEIEPGVFIYVPEPELLIAYKMGALIKREKALAIAPAQTGYFIPKILKDVHDVVRLFAKEGLDIDHKKLYGFLAAMKIPPYLPECAALVHRYATDADVAGLIVKFDEGYGKLERVAKGRKIQ